jgi:hypothetical protein
MTIPIFMSGVRLGRLLRVLMGLRVAQRWKHFCRRRHNIDRLIDPFQGEAGQQFIRQPLAPGASQDCSLPQHSSLVV